MILFHWTMIFLVFAIIAGVLGFGGGYQLMLGAIGSLIAKILFWIFLAVWLISFFYFNTMTILLPPFTLPFLIVAIITAFFAFGGGGVRKGAGIAKILFWTFLVIWLISFFSFNTRSQEENVISYDLNQNKLVPI